MKILRLKENRLDYYDEFIKNAEIAVEIVTEIKRYTENFNINTSKEIHETLDFLAKDFLPPIEREDIVLLANRIDDIIDYLDEIAINFNILNVVSLRDDFKQFIETINKLSILLKEMLEKFRDKKNYGEIHKLIIEINNFEENGDKIYEKSIKSLFKNETNSIEILRWNTIYNSLENCIDSFENVANTVGEIILKNT